MLSRDPRRRPICYSWYTTLFIQERDEPGFPGTAGIKALWRLQCMYAVRTGVHKMAVSLPDRSYY